MNDENYISKHKDPIIAKAIARIEQRAKDPNFWKPLPEKKIIPIKNRKGITWKSHYKALPEKLDLTRDEIEKREHLAKLLREAADIVQKYIDKFKDDEVHKYRIQDLERGLDNLVGRIDSIYAIDGWIVRHLMRPKNKRGGFGLSRGFGEMMMSYYKEDGDWTDEIMDAVDAVEKYYREV